MLFERNFEHCSFFIGNISGLFIFASTILDACRIGGKVDCTASRVIFEFLVIESSRASLLSRSGFWKF
ncbi:MAG: hypothetical protein ACFFCS_12345 [Candidatus Hodarchaeota archaeon]